MPDIRHAVSGGAINIFAPFGIPQERTLAAHGADFEEVVKETIFTTDMDALLKASDLRFEYYSKERLPTTSWVQVQRLVDPGFLVEIEVIAELP